jgi:hypothetical protein
LRGYIHCNRSEIWAVVLEYWLGDKLENYQAGVIIGNYVDMVIYRAGSLKLDAALATWSHSQFLEMVI